MTLIKFEPLKTPLTSKQEQRHLVEESASSVANWYIQQDWHSKNPDVARKQSLRAKKLWQNPSYRKKCLAAFRAYNHQHQGISLSEDIKQQMSKDMKK
jgi:hypothetical protein